MAAAYSGTAAMWHGGPARVYDRLAGVLADACPVPLAGACVLDLGAGTGAAARAAERRGAARVVAVDVAAGMLGADAGRRRPAVVGDAVALPFAAASFDVVVAAFSLTHLPAPAVGLGEAGRVLRRGGGLVVGAYAADDGHAARDATDEAARARGWVPPPWYEAVRFRTSPLLATADRALKAARAAGLAGVDVAHQRVAFPELTARDLVAWRMGMAQMAPFVAALAPGERAALAADALARLADAPVLVRSVIVLTARGAG